MRPSTSWIRPTIRWAVAATATVIMVGLSAYVLTHDHPEMTDELVAAPGETKVEPQVLFTDWPKDVKPEIVLVITGETYGYLQKCGCSNPQKGGLERRYNFMKMLRDQRGWEVVGIDAGDALQPLRYTPTSKQTVEKYAVAMQAMKLMGYRATSVGGQELGQTLNEVLAKYTLQPGNELPKVIFTNIANPENFPGAAGSMLHQTDVFSSKSGLQLGLLGVVGGEVSQKSTDREVKFDTKAIDRVKGILKSWDEAKSGPTVRIMMYQGPIGAANGAPGPNARTVANTFENLHVVICKTEDSEPPSQPISENKGRTLIVQPGQKGQNVGVLGIFRKKGSLEFHYQRVAMTEEFDTPADKVKQHPILKLLQEYSDTVKANDYMSEIVNRKIPHSIQVKNSAAKYVGDQQCFVCHQQEHQVWMKSKHAQAYKALAVIASKPSGRNFDGECIVCHTVGYEYASGFINRDKTPNLMNVQCESCHGPASLHIVQELTNLKQKGKANHSEALALSPWKTAGKGNLPSVEVMNKMATTKDPNQRNAMATKQENEVRGRVFGMCQICHDMDNDPKFDLEKYWKDVAHSGLNKQPAPGGGGKK